MTLEDAKAEVTKRFPNAMALAFTTSDQIVSWKVIALGNTFGDVTHLSKHCLSERGAWNAALEKLVPGSVVPLLPTEHMEHTCAPS